MGVVRPVTVHLAAVGVVVLGVFAAASLHSGHGPVAALLLEKSADPNAADVGYTALHAAVLRRDLGLVRTLLTFKANPDARMTKGTPMRRNSQDFDLPAVLIGATPFALAAKFLETEIVRELAAAGADTRMGLPDGTTPLLLALGAGVANNADRRGLSILDGGIIEGEEPCPRHGRGAGRAERGSRRRDQGRRFRRARRGAAWLRPGDPVSRREGGSVERAQRAGAHAARHAAGPPGPGHRA